MQLIGSGEMFVAHDEGRLDLKRLAALASDPEALWKAHLALSRGTGETLPPVVSKPAAPRKSRFRKLIAVEAIAATVALAAVTLLYIQRPVVDRVVTKVETRYPSQPVVDCRVYLGQKRGDRSKRLDLKVRIASDYEHAWALEASERGLRVLMHSRGMMMEPCGVRRLSHSTMPKAGGIWSSFLPRKRFWNWSGLGSCCLPKKNFGNWPNLLAITMSRRRRGSLPRPLSEPHRCARGISMFECSVSKKEGRRTQAS